MQIVHYPHPALRHKSKTIRRVDQQLRDIISEMFALMYASKGVGLAANQVDLPLRLFVANVTGELGQGEELVFINPVLSRAKGSDEAEEGCLSLPGLYAPVGRPKTVHVQAYNLQGEQLAFEATGMLSRVIQHETDHLDGVLFIDRLSELQRRELEEPLEEFEVEFRHARQGGSIPDDEAIARRLKELEERYC